MSRRLLKCRRICVISIGFLIILSFVVYSHYSNIIFAGNRMHGWMKNKVSQLTWSNIHCKNVDRWNASSKWPPIRVVGKQLMIKDGQSVFVNGMGCGTWLDGLHGVYPKLKLFGIDTHFGSVHHVRSLVNGTFDTRQPFELVDLTSDYHNFDHALIPGTLSILSRKQQCDTVSQILPMIKPGGSLYIGNNFEDCHNVVSSGKLLHMAKFTPLPQCFWSEVCLKERHDIAEIIYVNEEDAYDSQYLHPELKKCASAIFVYKAITIHKHKNKNPLYPSLKFPGQVKPHRCSKSNINNSKKSDHKMKESIKKAVREMKLKGLDLH
eukprot:gene15060-16615_t